MPCAASAGAAQIAALSMLAYLRRLIPTTIDEHSRAHRHISDGVRQLVVEADGDQPR